MDYSEYLPDIKVADGLARVMGNMKLYFRLAERFDGEKMAAEIIRAINEGDQKATLQAAHAMRGTAANLAFPVVQQAAGDIEDKIKAGEDCRSLVEPLNASVAALSSAVSRLLEKHGT